jgi:CRP-like cAMP-binding protein
MLKEDSRNGNNLLSVLNEVEWDRVAPHLMPVDMPLGQVVYEAGDRLDHVYFPATSIVSLLYVLENGASAEIAIVGNEGIVGIALFMGGETTPNRAVVQSAGRAYRLDARVLKEEFHRAGALQRLLLRYTQTLITQIAQTAACNRYHSIDQQLCRWLLLSIDRLPSNELTMTQELIANMLGVRRAGVTQAAVKLQDAGLIRYSYGRELDSKGACANATALSGQSAKDCCLIRRRCDGSNFYEAGGNALPVQINLDASDFFSSNVRGLSTKDRSSHASGHSRKDGKGPFLAGCSLTRNSLQADIRRQYQVTTNVGKGRTVRIAHPPSLGFLLPRRSR